MAAKMIGLVRTHAMPTLRKIDVNNTSRHHALAIGARVRQAREAKRYEREQLALRSGITASSLRRIEHGAVLARTSTLLRIAPMLGVDLDWLELGTGKGPNHT